MPSENQQKPSTLFRIDFNNLQFSSALICYSNSGTSFSQNQITRYMNLGNHLDLKLVSFGTGDACAIPVAYTVIFFFNKIKVGKDKIR